ncbi:MAG: dienelactone hydrolase family protein [Planctomycetes bacterium]|nr:dienelactone hydrolase family protein [Planctomycetota bacterium]
MHHRPVRTLAAGLFVASALLAAEPAAQDARELNEKFQAGMAAHQAKNYAKSIPLFEELYEKLPATEQLKRVCAYNAACGLALQGGKVDEAFAWLEKAVEAGFGINSENGDQPGDLDLAKTDTDLDSLRKDPRFEKWIAKVAEVRARAEAILKDLETPLLYAPEVLDAKKAAPLVVLCHGAGDNKKNFLERNWKDVADALGLRLVSVPGPEATAAQSFRWYKPGSDGMEAVRNGVEARVLSAVEAAKKQWAVEPTQVILAGFSQGAFIALHTALRNPGVFQGALVIAGFADDAALAEALAKPETKKLRMVGIAGKLDKRSHEQLSKTHAAMAAAGIASEFREHDGGHTFPKDRAAAIQSALAFLTGKSGSDGKPASAPSSSDKK